ncbi:MAG TPA: alpha/beta hydrolase [Vicinamibacterales bacterium]
MIRLAVLVALAAAAVQVTPQPVNVGGVTLHYVERGAGEPMILLHGGQGDYRAWDAHLPELSRYFRAIPYSRRHHYPNNNPIQPDHSARVDAQDLAAFVAARKLGPVHLVGTSYGALTALMFALERPTQVRSLVLAEPPVLEWAHQLPGGKELYEHFMNNVHRRAGRAFVAGNDAEALRLLIDEFDGAGAFDRLPAERRQVVMQNANFFRAVTASSDPFPNLDRDAVRRLPVPMLVVRGEHTDALHRMLAEHLASLKGGTVTVIPRAGHGSPRQNPVAFTGAVLGFLKVAR